MKRTDLIRRIEELGAVFVREGSAHAMYENPRTRKRFSVPRHREVNEYTARGIIRDAAED